MCIKARFEMHINAAQNCSAAYDRLQLGEIFLRIDSTALNDSDDDADSRLMICKYKVVVEPHRHPSRTPMGERWVEPVSVLAGEGASARAHDLHTIGQSP